MEDEEDVETNLSNKNKNGVQHEPERADKVREVEVREAANELQLE